MPMNPLSVGASSQSARTADVQLQPANALLRYHGYSVYEDAGTPALASFLLRNGTAATAPIIGACKLAASGAKNEWYPEGIPCPLGLFLDMVAGSVAGAIYFSMSGPH